MCIWWKGCGQVQNILTFSKFHNVLTFLYRTRRGNCEATAMMPLCFICSLYWRCKFHPIWNHSTSNLHHVNEALHWQFCTVWAPQTRPPYQLQFHPCRHLYVLASTRVLAASVNGAYLWKVHIVERNAGSIRRVNMHIASRRLPDNSVRRRHRFALHCWRHLCNKHKQQSPITNRVR